MFGIPATILWAIGSMAALGLLFGVGLVLAARKFRPREDARIGKALGHLPGVNCAACGYAGCHSYAEALAAGEKVTLCAAGGPDVASALADVMGVEVGEVRRQRAVLHCQGGTRRCGDRFEYVGLEDCRAAHIISGGPKACTYGCLGMGSCARACPFGAISMSEERLPTIDAAKCTGCGTCVRTCPRNLLGLLPVEYKVYLGCASHDKGEAVKDVCSVGCIACGLCAKNEPRYAIQLMGNLPVLDYAKAQGDFRKAAEACPMNCFVIEEGEGAAVPLAALSQEVKEA
jgi:Na+-translocating ferredoxin:NAD+ oxidoreductase RNF subunit RnfB